MAKEIPEEEVLLVHDKEDKRIKAVKGIDMMRERTIGFPVCIVFY